MPHEISESLEPENKPEVSQKKSRIDDAAKLMIAGMVGAASGSIATGHYLNDQYADMDHRSEILKSEKRIPPTGVYSLNGNDAGDPVIFESAGKSYVIEDAEINKKLFEASQSNPGLKAFVEGGTIKLVKEIEEVSVIDIQKKRSCKIISQSFNSKFQSISFIPRSNSVNGLPLI